MSNSRDFDDDFDSSISQFDLINYSLYEEDNNSSYPDEPINYDNDIEYNENYSGVNIENNNPPSGEYQEEIPLQNNTVTFWLPDDQKNDVINDLTMKVERLQNIYNHVKRIKSLLQDLVRIKNRKLFLTQEDKVVFEEYCNENNAHLYYAYRISIEDRGRGYILPQLKQIYIDFCNGSNRFTLSEENIAVIKKEIVILQKRFQRIKASINKLTQPSSTKEPSRKKRRNNKQNIDTENEELKQNNDLQEIINHLRKEKEDDFINKEEQIKELGQVNNLLCQENQEIKRQNDELQGRVSHLINEKENYFLNKEEQIKELGQVNNLLGQENQAIKLHNHELQGIISHLTKEKEDGLINKEEQIKELGQVNNLLGQENRELQTTISQLVAVINQQVGINTLPFSFNSPTSNNNYNMRLFPLKQFPLGNNTVVSDNTNDKTYSPKKRGRQE